MAMADPSQGKMDITEQQRTYSGFLQFTLWGTFILALILTHSTLTLVLGLHWLVSLTLCVLLGVVGGMFLGMGTVWLVTVAGLAGLAVFVQVLIALFRLALPG